MAKVITVGKNNSQYDVHIFNKSINKASLVRALKNNNKVLIITDSGIPKKYLNELKFILRPLKLLFMLRKAVGTLICPCKIFFFFYFNFLFRNQTNE